MSYPHCKAHACIWLLMCGRIPAQCKVHACIWRLICGRIPAQCNAHACIRLLICGRTFAQCNRCLGLSLSSSRHCVALHVSLDDICLISSSIILADLKLINNKCQILLFACAAGYKCAADTRTQSHNTGNCSEPVGAFTQLPQSSHIPKCDGRALLTSFLPTRQAQRRFQAQRRLQAKRKFPAICQASTALFTVGSKAICAFWLHQFWLHYHLVSLCSSCIGSTQRLK